MRVLLWLVEGTWQGCVDAARALVPANAEVTLLYVAPSEVEEAVGGAVAGLLGRGRPRPGRDPAERISVLSDQAAAALLPPPRPSSAGRHDDSSAAAGSSGWSSRPPKTPTCWW